MRAVGRLCVLAFVCVGLASEAYAQISTGGIRGFLRDETGAVLPGVTVEAESPARIGGAAVDTTDSQGMYRFENLPVGIYTVTFTMTGFTTVKREGIRVEVGRTIELDQPMTLSTVQETITVTGEAPVVDAAHAGTSTNFNQELLANAPTSRNQFFDALAYAPAVKSSSVNIGGTSQFVIFGSDSNQNAFQYDGIDVSAPSFGGPFDWPNFDMMQELQVKAVGATAEQAGFQGGVINLVLKSGSNTFKGSGSFYGIWNNLVSNNTPKEEFPAHVHHRLDYNYSFGGPIQRDRLWFQYISEHIRWVRSAVGVPPDRPDKTRIWRPFIKIDGRLSDTDHFSVHYNDCRDWWGYGASKTTPPESASVEVGYDPVITTRYTHMFGNATMFEAKAGGVFVRKDYLPVSGNLDVPGRTDLETGLTSVNRVEPTYRDHQNKMNINATLAHTATEFIRGTHEFKFGVQTAPWNTATARGAYIGGTRIYDSGGAPYYAVFQEPYATGGRIRTFGGFVQDDWTVNDRVALNLGVRYDKTLADIPSLAQLDGKLNPTGKTFPGVADVMNFNDVSPRLGITVKLDRDGKTVAKSFYGRYFGKVIAPMFDSGSPGYPRYDAFFWNPATGRYDIPYYSFDPVASYGGVDPNLENQYTDQFFIGLERQIQSDFGVTLSFVMKTQNNFIRLQDVRGVYATRPIVDTFEGRTQTLTVFNRISPGSQSSFQVVNRDDLDADYKTFVAEANKRFSDRWQVLASYQFARNRLFAKGNLGSQNFGNLGLFGQGGYGRDPNDLINSYGPSSVEAEHSVRTTLTYEAPFGIHVGARYFYDTGRPYGRIINVPLSQGIRQVLAEPRGTYHMPDQHDVRLRLDKDFRLGGSRRLRFSIDLINLLNDDTPTSLRNNSSQRDYGEFLGFVEPRRGQIGIRFEF
jgi:outer membrane receptor protein involved in Fe transport